MAAVAWPTTAELAKRLNVPSGEWEDPHFDRMVAAAIAHTKKRIGEWDDQFDQPDEQVSQSALELAVEMAQTGADALTNSKSKSYALLFGKRRRFGIG